MSLLARSAGQSQDTLCAQVDAVKRNCLKVLPHTLVIHLKRFEFDYETMTRWKIKDRHVGNCSPPLLHTGPGFYSGTMFTGIVWVLPLFITIFGTTRQQLHNSL